MSAQNDGGQAFPGERLLMRAGYVTSEREPVNGMTLRDYAAIHSVQPGCGEIARMAGLTYSLGAVWSDESTRVGSFDDWFNGLPLERSLELFAMVKYAIADAMLKARKQ